MLIYIMGRGHSGSTILDVMLGNSAACESVGQLVTGLLKETEGHVCACGTPMQDCPYWAAVRQAFTEISALDWRQTAMALAEHSHIRNLPHTLLARPGSPAMRQLAEGSIDLERAIARASGKPHVVDSSKDSTRGLMLLRFAPEARVVHLVRDPRRLVASYYWRFKEWGGYFNFLRRIYYLPSMLVPLMLLTALSWTAGNVFCELARCFARERTLRIRYEDLCEAPAAELGRIARAFDIPLDDAIAKVTNGEPLIIGHNVGGNQIRTEGAVTFTPGKGREHAMPRWLELVTVACCWPLMLAYGYKLREPEGHEPQQQTGMSREAPSRPMDS